MTFPTCLKRLQTELVDARQGYEERLKFTADGEIAALLLEMLELRMRAEQQIREILGTKGTEGDGRGSLASSIHRAVAKVGAFVVADGLQSLSACARAEMQILLAYNNAIDECRPYQRITDLLESQRATLVKAVARLDQAVANRTGRVHGGLVERTF